jgi:hypothetical protein
VIIGDFSILTQEVLWGNWPASGSSQHVNINVVTRTETPNSHDEFSREIFEKVGFPSRFDVVILNHGFDFGGGTK